MKEEASAYIVRKELDRGRLWQGGGPLLPSLDIELTERCNNNCIHCYINRAADDPEAIRLEMSIDRVKSLLEEAASLGCMTVRFTGGEPLLRAEFQEIYLHTRRLGIKVQLLTNATLVTQELAELFRRYPPGHPIEITLYGMKRETYQATSRVKGSFAAAMAGMNRLMENKIPISLKTIRLPGRDDELTEFLELSRKHSADGRPGGISMNFILRGRRDDEEKNRQIAGLRATPRETLAILARDGEQFIRAQREFATKFMGSTGADLFACGCGKGGTVDAYGYFQPCLLLRAPRLAYDLGQGTLHDALTRFFPRALKKAEKNPDYLARCARCFLKSMCDQCPAWSWSENGTLDTPVDYLCQVSHEQARYLGLLSHGEMAWQIEDWVERVRRFVAGAEVETQ